MFIVGYVGGKSAVRGSREREKRNEGNSVKGVCPFEPSENV